MKIVGCAEKHTHREAGSKEQHLSGEGAQLASPRNASQGIHSSIFIVKLSSPP